MSSRLAALSSLLLAVLPGCGGGKGGVPVRRVILVSCDTLRADRLGFYGYPPPTSPHLDAFARESLVFDSAWSTAPLTRPSLSALFTGRLPDDVGMGTNRDILSPEATTLAEALSAAGIETAAIVSNWVLRALVERPGAGLAQGFQHFDDAMKTVELNRPDQRDRVAQDTTDAAIRWLDGRARDERFFLWVHYQDPHGPYTPPASYPPDFERPLGEEPLLEVCNDQRGRGCLPRYQRLGDERAPEYYRIRYDAEIRYFDQELGRLLERLRASGLLEDALVFFTADHGESLGEHGCWFSHGQNLHSELVRVPFLLHLPPGLAHPEARDSGGYARVSEPVSHLDIWPTVLAAFGLESGACRGTNLLVDRLPPERILPQSLGGRGWSATTARYRLVVQGGASALFDIERDPLELVDLASREPERVAELARRHQAFLEQIALQRITAQQQPDDKESRRALESLGYGGRGDE